MRRDRGSAASGTGNRSPHRPARLHAGVVGHGLTSQGGDLGVVGGQQGAKEHLGQLFGREPLTAASAPLPFALALPFAFGRVLTGEFAVDVAVDAELRAAHREVHLEGGLKRLPVRRRLDQRRRQGVLEGVAVFERDVTDRIGGVDGFSE